ncbi:hypothetical protein [Paracoccus alkenifer]|nr:hypothetical protein [Paracoccus alkenifer]
MTGRAATGRGKTTRSGTPRARPAPELARRQEREIGHPGILHPGTPLNP